MFERLGKFVTRRWLILLVGWIAILVGINFIAPPWEKVAKSGQFVFLPSNSPSRVGEELFEKAFPNDMLSSSIVVVLHREGDKDALNQGDEDFIEDVFAPRLLKVAEDMGGLADRDAPPPADKPHSLISRIHTMHDKVMGGLLVSEDRRASLVVIELTSVFLDFRSHPTVKGVENLIEELKQAKKVPAGLEISLTGSATLGRDMQRAEKQSADDIQLWTLILVIVLLIAIYRAPVLALLPLVTLAVSVDIAVKLLSMMAQAGWIQVFAGLQVYITVVVYGAGVDYCVFLTARYKEALEEGMSVPDAISESISKVGAALAASAGTVMCGIGMMAFAEFGKFREAGIGISFALLIVFLGTMTFTPALLRLAGRFAFWPRDIRGGSTAANLASDPANPVKRIMEHPLLQNFWDHVGVLLVKRPATIWVLSTAAMVPFIAVSIIFYNHLSYGLIDELPHNAPTVAGAKALQRHFPAGMTGPITVLVSNPKVDFSTSEGQEEIQKLVDSLKDHPSKLQIADIRSVATPLGWTAAAKGAFKGGGKAGELFKRGATLKKARDYYISHADGLADHVTRLDIILQRDPFAQHSIRILDQVRKAVTNEPLGRESSLAFIGPTASVADLEVVAGHDRVWVNTLVVGVVFAILVVLLKEFVVTIYLIVSVLLSYFTTLGLTYLVFWAIEGPEFVGLDWTVPMFLFTVLVAVGEDYNIFLMARVHEEQREHGAVKGVTLALSRTGSIISSCGLIMAGTFASLMAGTLSRMNELGFALAFGVLLDTFVVRPILVPAFLILRDTGRFGSISKFMGTGDLSTALDPTHGVEPQIDHLAGS